MPRRLLAPGLRRTLALSVLGLAAFATVAMVAVWSIAVGQNEEADRDASAFIVQQQIADRLISLTYQQQVQAVRFVESADPVRLARFRAIGDQAYAEMRRYLFHDLSAPARLQVERMKETHQGFEVVAQRVFELARRGDEAEVRRRLALLESRASELDTAVATFLSSRLEQRRALLVRHREFTRRVRLGLATTAALLFVAGTAIAIHLHRRVIRPLEHIAEVAERIRAGDDAARLRAQPDVEHAVVATAFNEMADAVQLSRETMEMQNEELRESLDQLRTTQDELVQHEKLSAMGQMLAGLAHELNNPLGGILGMAELLKSELADSPDPGARELGAELAAPLEREALRARDLVRSLLGFARRASGEARPVPLAAAVGTAVGLCAHAYLQAGKRLDVGIPAMLGVMADPQKLQVVVLNLVNNALEAMQGVAGGALVIRASTEGGDMVRIDFEDEGPGFIDPRAAFEPFYTTKGPDKGTGLGLALVRKFVTEFGGTVTAANRAEGGARVSLLLRHAVTGSDMTGTAAMTKDDTPLPHVAVAPDEMRRPRVLVIDDEPSLREIQRRLLMLEGLDVAVAASVEEAMSIIRAERVDLVVSDLRMPGALDGRHLLAMLDVEQPALAGTALLVTGDISGVDVAGFPVPPDRVISKPFRRAEYVARVRRALVERVASSE